LVAAISVWYYKKREDNQIKLITLPDRQEKKKERIIQIGFSGSFNSDRFHTECFRHRQKESHGKLMLLQRCNIQRWLQNADLQDVDSAP
jgi:hypothetical protein